MQLVSCLNGLDSVVPVHKNINIFYCLVNSNPVNLGTSGQSYKHFMLINYDSRGVVTRELPILRL